MRERGLKSIIPLKKSNTPDEYRCKNPQKILANQKDIKRILHHDQVGVFQGVKDDLTSANQSIR